MSHYEDLSGVQLTHCDTLLIGRDQKLSIVKHS